MRIFIFGSLLSQKVLNTVIGNDHIILSNIPYTTIPDFKAFYVVDEDYPMLVKKNGEQTLGKIVSITNKIELDRLRYYEGEENPLLLINEESSLHSFIADSTLTPSLKTWSYQEWEGTSTSTQFVVRVQNYMNLFNKDARPRW